MSSARTLAFELGCEEIPAFDLHNATAALGDLARNLFDAAKIPHGDIRVLSTPRRLIVLVSDVADATAAVDEEFRGPSAKAAFDAEGDFTKAALGFARGKGVDASALEVCDVDGVPYVFAVRHLDAQPTASLLGPALENLIESIPWSKSCRWARRSELFSRPVRWIVALLGSEVVPVEFAGLKSGNLTWGHRVLSPGAHEVPSADKLIDVLRACRIVVSEEEREQRIREGVARIEAETGSRAELPAKTLLEVVNLSEHPAVLCGTFDEEFLKVPEEIIVDAMLMHQRYFPLYDGDGRLTNRFIVVSNGDPECGEVITAGNERVVRARLDDAKFFYEEDLKRPLEDYVAGLDSVVFQETLGTMRDKTARIEAVAAHLAVDAGLSDAEAALAVRAAHLAKADLVTNAVVEFTSVQGIMGAYYAEAAGEDAAVAEAVRDHYRPRFSGDALPATPVGKVVAAADKLDTICGLFAVGQGPTGSSDPFALRRSAIGILALMEDGLSISLVRAVDASLAAYAEGGLSFDPAAVRAEVLDFFITRTRVMLRDGGAAPDAVDAVLAVGVEEPSVFIARVSALEAARANAPETFSDLAIAYARANNLRDAKLGVDVDRSLFDDVESALDAAIESAGDRVSAALAAGDYPAALDELAALRAPIDMFFEVTLVMDEDAALRTNRLRLLNRFVSVFVNVADFGKMAKAGK